MAVQANGKPEYWEIVTLPYFDEETHGVACILSEGSATAGSSFDIETPIVYYDFVAGKLIEGPEPVSCAGMYIQWDDQYQISEARARKLAPQLFKHPWVMEQAAMGREPITKHRGYITDSGARIEYGPHVLEYAKKDGQEVLEVEQAEDKEAPMPLDNMLRIISHNIGRVVTYRMKREAGLTQEMIADRAGISAPHLSRIMNGHVENLELKTIAQLQDALQAEVISVGLFSWVHFTNGLTEEESEDLIKRWQRPALAA
jgi:hypothetical protein